jgi:hypothetical protein
MRASIEKLLSCSTRVIELHRNDEKSNEPTIKDDMTF